MSLIVIGCSSTENRDAMNALLNDTLTNVPHEADLSREWEDSCPLGSKTLHETAYTFGEFAGDDRAGVVDDVIEYWESLDPDEFTLRRDGSVSDHDAELEGPGFTVTLGDVESERAVELWIWGSSDCE